MSAGFERRLAKVEKASGIHRGDGAFVVHDNDRADIRADAGKYERTRLSEETPGEFRRRVFDEAARFGPRMVAVTRGEYDAIVARIDAEV